MPPRSGAAFGSAAPSLAAARTCRRYHREERSCVLILKPCGSLCDFLGNPILERGDLDVMLARRSMNFLDHRQLVRVEPPCQPHQRRPEAAMDVGDFTTDEAAHQHVCRCADRTREI